MADKHTEWLPLAREESLTKHMSMHLIKQEKHRDWFMNLAWAVTERGDQTQGRMLAKTFLFLRDFRPRGLVADLAHVHGNDVMGHLLSNKEHAVSRHKLTRDANDAFTELDEWMKKGNDWKEALRNAKAGAPGNKRNSGRAPGLCSPACLLAVLIIAHPDTKFRSWVGRLGITWMLSPDDTLDVRDGYWKGLDAQNLHTCFRPAESPTTKTQLFADYDLLFGPGFCQARRDMRPHLPGWAKHLTLDEEPCVDSDDVEGDQEQGRVHELHSLLHPSGAEAPAVLQAWLLQLLDSEESDDAVLAKWCAHWTGRMEKADSHQEQVILRSLFLQSLCVLRGLTVSKFTHTSEVTVCATTTAYMLLDIEDAGLEVRAQNPPATMQKMMKAPTFSRYTDKIAELSSLAGIGGKTIDEMAARQGAFFWELMKHGSFAKHSNHVVEFDTLRVGALIHTAKAVVGEAVDNPVGSYSNRESLMLTHWQNLQLVTPGADMNAILTEQQLQVFRQEADDGMQFIDLSESLSVGPEDLSVEDEHSEKGQMIRTLFGALGRTASESSPASPQTPSTQTSRRTQATEISQGSNPTHTTRAASAAEAVTSTEPAEPTRPTPTPQAPVSTAPSRPGQTPAGRATRSIGSTGAGHGPTSPAHPMLKLFRDNTQAGVKRRADGTPKTSRLWEMTRQDLSEELTSGTDGVKQCFNAASKELSHDVRQQLDAMRAEMEVEVKAEIKAEIKAMRDESQTELAAVRDGLKALQNDPRLDLNAAVAAARAQMSTELRAVIDAQVASSIKSVLDGVHEVKELLARPREPGEEGYLSEHCPAPDGLAQQTCRQKSSPVSWSILIRRRHLNAASGSMVLYQFPRQP